MNATLILVQTVCYTILALSSVIALVRGWRILRPKAQLVQELDASHRAIREKNETISHLQSAIGTLEAVIEAANAAHTGWQNTIEALSADVRDLHEKVEDMDARWAVACEYMVDLIHEHESNPGCALPPPPEDLRADIEAAKQKRRIGTAAIDAANSIDEGLREGAAPSLLEAAQ